MLSHTNDTILGKFCPLKRNILNPEKATPQFGNPPHPLGNHFKMSHVGSAYHEAGIPRGSMHFRNDSPGGAGDFHLFNGFEPAPLYSCPKYVWSTRI